MGKSHGTPCHTYTNGQIVTVGARILTALPKGLARIDPKIALKFSERGERLEAAIGAMFDMLYGGHVATTPSRPWREENGVIYFSVTSDGTTGEGWIRRFTDKGVQVQVDGDAKHVLCSPEFIPTNGITTEVAVLKGMLFEDNDRITKKIRAYAKAFRTSDKRKLIKPNAELACLIRLQFTDKEIAAMGLWYIVAMHKPINNSDGVPHLLSAGRGGDGRWVDAYCDDPDGGWAHDFGFAFAVSSS